MAQSVDATPTSISLRIFTTSPKLAVLVDV